MVFYTLNLPWMLIEPTAYGGFMMLVLLSKIEDIYIFNTTNLHQNAVKNYLKPPKIRLIRNCKKPHQSKKKCFELEWVKGPLC